MTNTQELLNKLLVQLFNDILHIEENSLKNTIEAVGIKDAKTMGEIAHDLRITVGTLSAAITKLIKKGYVERKRTEEDRRVVLVSLTSKGENVYREHQVFHEEMITSMLGNFSEEEEYILAIALEKLKDLNRKIKL